MRIAQRLPHLAPHGLFHIAPRKTGSPTDEAEYGLWNLYVNQCVPRAAPARRSAVKSAAAAADRRRHSADRPPGRKSADSRPSPTSSACVTYTGPLLSLNGQLQATLRRPLAFSSRQKRRQLGPDDVQLIYSSNIGVDGGSLFCYGFIRDGRLRRTDRPAQRTDRPAQRTDGQTLSADQDRPAQRTDGQTLSADPDRPSRQTRTDPPCARTYRPD